MQGNQASWGSTSVWQGPNRDALFTTRDLPADICRENCYLNHLSQPPECVRDAGCKPLHQEPPTPRQLWVPHWTPRWLLLRVSTSYTSWDHGAISGQLQCKSHLMGFGASWPYKGLSFAHNFLCLFDWTISYNNDNTKFGQLSHQ